MGSVGQSDLESCYVGCRQANRNHQNCANLTLRRLMREKKKSKTSLQENTLPKAPGGDLNLIHLMNKDSPGCFGKAVPTPYLLRAIAA